MARDRVGNTEAAPLSADKTATTRDTQLPTITLTGGVISLFPPNHDYVTFSVADLAASASDACDATVNICKVVISEVTSDEPENAKGNGDGNTLSDIVIARDCKSVKLRAERADQENGRLYKIMLQVKDASGNVGTAVRQVLVPVTRGGSVIDSGPKYRVTGCSP